jgi:hypothetical protein
LKEFERRGILPEDFDFDKNVAELTDEMKDTFGGPAFNNLPVEDDEDDDDNEETEDKNDEQTDE